MKRYNISAIVKNVSGRALLELLRLKARCLRAPRKDTAQTQDADRVQEVASDASSEVFLETAPAVSAARSMMDALDSFLGQKLKAFLSNPEARMALPLARRPKISILIAFFNRAAYTLACLESLAAHADEDCEILLVDDGSTDETTGLLARIDNALVISNRENVGFLKACNQAADRATGDWLLFLNNDTQILPGFLSALLRAGESTAHCGAVGGRLILPDGTLQEAGSIIWNDGSCAGYGRGDDPFKPEYSYLREVHYCSGACLMVKKRYFESAGRFDEQYAPAYYEETDLCMKLREMGLQVIYQPAAVLMHYEFGSAPSREQVRRIHVRNMEIFHHKWTHRLNAHPASSEDPLRCREILPAGKKRILVVDDLIPDPALGSGFPRTHLIVRLLADLGHAVTFYPLQFPERREPVTHELQQRGVEVMYAREGAPLDFESFLSSRLHHYDALWISRPHNMEQLGPVLRRLAPDLQLIYDAEALFVVREILKSELDGQAISPEEKHEMIEKEIALMRQADVVVTVSLQEKSVVEKFYSGIVCVLGHCHDLVPTPLSFSERKDILFVGSFLRSPSPNEDAVQYFMDHLYPKIYEATGAGMHIVGTNYLESVRRLENASVRVAGRVDDLFEYYNRCRLFVVPHRYAAGIPLKLIECMTYGLPAIVTPLIAGQLGLDEQAALIGATDADFIAKAVKAYTSETVWKALRAGSLRYVQDHHSPASFKERLNAILSSGDGEAAAYSVGPSAPPSSELAVQPASDKST